MRKKFYTVSLALALLIMGCDSPSNLAQTDPGKPKIPTKKPSLPQSQLAASVLGAVQPSPTPSSPSYDMRRVIDKINQNILPQTIAAADIERGWYFAGQNERRIGTPDTWVFIDRGGESVWSSPTVVIENRSIGSERLCKETAGQFIYACAERENRDCENIPNSLCRCSDFTSWVEKQGCILTDEQGKFVAINATDTVRGWYLGLPNEKKLDTPASWIWQELGQKSRWQSPPSPQD